MNWEKTPEEIEELKRRAQELLDEYVREKKYDFSLKVIDEYVQQEDWLHLIVEPDREGVRAYDYAKALTDVGNKLRRDDHVEHVLLLPTLAA